MVHRSGEGEKVSVSGRQFVISFVVYYTTFSLRLIL